MNVLEQAQEIVEDLLSHINDLDEYDVLLVAGEVVMLASLEYDYDPREE